MAGPEEHDAGALRDALLSAETVEAVAGELFAQDAQEPIRDAAGGWRKERLRRAARSLLEIALEEAERRVAARPRDSPPRA